MENSSAIIVCPSSASPDQRLLGLSVGERLLLTLSHGGFKRVAFVGDGPRPRSRRAGLEVVERSELSGTVLWLVCDLTFDKGLIKEGARIPPGLPIRWDSVDAQLQDSLPQQAGRSDAFALRVTGRQSLREARRTMLRSLRKPADGIISRHLNRYVSLAVTRQLVRLGLAPNVFTVLFMGIGLAAAACVVYAEHWWALVLGGALFQAQSILDGCDGEMARLTFRFSKSGQWLDTIGDDITNYAYCFALAAGLARTHQEPMFWWVGAAILVLQLSASAVMYRRMILWGTGDLLAIPVVGGGAQSDNPLTSILHSIGKRDFFVFAISLLTAAQLPLVAFVAFGAGTLPVLVMVVINDRRVAKLSPPGRR